MRNQVFGPEKSDDSSSSIAPVAALAVACLSPPSKFATANAARGGDVL